MACLPDASGQADSRWRVCQARLARLAVEISKLWQAWPGWQSGARKLWQAWLARGLPKLWQAWLAAAVQGCRRTTTTTTTTTTTWRSPWPAEPIAVARGRARGGRGRARGRLGRARGRLGRANDPPARAGAGRRAPSVAATTPRSSPRPGLTSRVFRMGRPVPGGLRVRERAGGLAQPSGPVCAPLGAARADLGAPGMSAGRPSRAARTVRCVPTAEVSTGMIVPYPGGRATFDTGQGQLLVRYVSGHFAHYHLQYNRQYLSSLPPGYNVRAGLLPTRAVTKSARR